MLKNARAAAGWLQAKRCSALGRAALAGSAGAALPASPRCRAQVSHVAPARAPPRACSAPWPEPGPPRAPRRESSRRGLRVWNRPLPGARTGETSRPGSCPVQRPGRPGWMRRRRGGLVRHCLRSHRNCRSEPTAPPLRKSASRAEAPGGPPQVLLCSPRASRRGLGNQRAAGPAAAPPGPSRAAGPQSKGQALSDCAWRREPCITPGRLAESWNP